MKAWAKALEESYGSGGFAAFHAACLEKIAEIDPEFGAFEVDESYFGGSRKGKRGRGAVPGNPASWSSLNESYSYPWMPKQSGLGYLSAAGLSSGIAKMRPLSR